jgi:hypothetical protein
MARLVPTDDPSLMAIGGGPLENALLNAASTARRLTVFAMPALALGLVLLAASVGLARDRRRGLRAAALTVAGAGGVAIAVPAAALAVLLGTFDTSHGDAVVRTIWNAYLGGLRGWGVALGLAGVLVAAAADSTGMGELARRMLRPARTRGRVWRAGGLLGIAALLLTVPAIALELAVVTGAGVAVFVAAGELLRATGAERFRA